MVRLVAAWVVIVALLAVLSAPSAHATALPAWGATVVFVVFAAFAAIGTSTARLLAAVRAGEVVVDAPAPGWHLWRRSWGQGAIAGALVYVLGQLVDIATVGRVAGPLLGGVIGVAVGVIVQVPPSASARVVGVWRWLILEGALPTAVMAAVLGGAVAAHRFGIEGEHSPGAVSRMLAGTFLCEALLGFGGFAKSWAERRFGLVKAPDVSLPDVPGPVVVALALAAVTVIFGPRLLPVMAATTVVAVKVVSGAVVAGGLSALGAIRGARAASSAQVLS